MPKRSVHRLLAGFRVTSLGTLASRVLGLARDVATAAFLGASGPIDALLVAFRVPDLFRRLFAEGAITAAYLPKLAAKLETDREAARRLAGTTLLVMTVLLGVVVLILELACSTAWFARAESDALPHVARLTAILLPYVLLVCVTAQLAGTLHGLRHFTWPAVAPVLFNIGWLVTLCLVAPLIAETKQGQVYVLAWGIVGAGVLQAGSQVFALWQLQFLPSVDFASSWESVKQILWATAPAMFSLAALHINTFVDAWTAWAMTASDAATPAANWPLLGRVGQVLQPGAASLLYYSERLYMFPVGLIGLAAATAVYPQLAADAAADRKEEAGRDVVLGLRLILTLALPASAGLSLLAGPITQLLLEHGEFDAASGNRAAAMIAIYGSGVWAFCCVPLVVRALLAFNDTRRAVAATLAAILLNIPLNLVLARLFGECGLVAASVAASAVQLLLLVVMLDRKHAVLQGKQLILSVLRSLTATAVMTAAGYFVIKYLPSNGGSLAERGLAVAVPIAACVTVYFGTHLLLGGSALRLVVEAMTKDDTAE